MSMNFIEQIDLLTICAYRERGGKTITAMCPTNLFEPVEMRNLADRLYAYIDEHKEPPKDLFINMILDLKRQFPDDRETYDSIRDAINDARPNINEDYTIPKLRRFMRTQNMNNALRKIIELHNAGDDEAALQLMVRATDQRDAALDPGFDLNKLERYIGPQHRDQSDIFETGISILDKHRITPMRKEMLMYVAGAKKGKCVHEDMQVVMANGRVATIGQLAAYNKPVTVLALNETTGKLVPVRVDQFYDNGVKPCYKVFTRTGREASTTANHAYLTPHGWKDLAEIEIGDYIAVPRRIAFFGKDRVNDDELSFLAFMLAEGCTVHTKNHSLVADFTNTDAELIVMFQATCDRLGVGYRPHGTSFSLSGNGRDLIRKFGMDGCSARTKRIPDCLFCCPQDQVATFLRIFFSCDGHIRPDVNFIEVTLANKVMIRQISHLLLRFGVVHRVKYKKAKALGKEFDAWRITIQSWHGVKAFLTEIGMLTYKKHDAAEVGDHRDRSFLDSIPPTIAQQMLVDADEELNDTMPVPVAAGGGYVRCGHWLAKRMTSQRVQTLRKSIKRGRCVMPKSFAAVADLKCISRVLKSDMMWDRVVSIQRAGPAQTYDIPVAEHHNFVANDCLIHNTQAMVQFGRCAMLMRKRVCHVTLEMPLEQILERYLRSLTAMGDEDIVQRGRIEKDAEGRYIGHSVEEVENRARFGTDDGDRVINAFLRRFKGRLPLKIKEFPSGKLSVSGLRKWLRALESVHNYIPDLLLIDYPDLMKEDTGTNRDYRLQLDKILVDIRGIGSELGCAIVVASQTNREGSHKANVRAHDVAESFGKIMTFDKGIFYSQTDYEHENHLGRLFVLGRAVKSSFQFLISQCYDTSTFAVDCAYIDKDCYPPRNSPDRSSTQQSSSREGTGRRRTPERESGDGDRQDADAARPRSRAHGSARPYSEFEAFSGGTNTNGHSR